MASIGMPEVFVARIVSALQAAATFPNSEVLMSSRSTTASITKSLSPTAAARSSSRLPAFMRLRTDGLISAGGFDLVSALSAPKAIFERTSFGASAGTPFGTMSRR